MTDVESGRTAAGLDPVPTTERERVALQRLYEQRALNMAFLNDHDAELSERFRNHFVVVYDGGKSVVPFAEAIKANEFLHQLPSELRNTAICEFLDDVVTIPTFAVQKRRD